MNLHLTDFSYATTLGTLFTERRLDVDEMDCRCDTIASALRSPSRSSVLCDGAASHASCAESVDSSSNAEGSSPDIAVHEDCVPNSCDGPEDECDMRLAFCCFRRSTAGTNKTYHG